MNDRSDRHLLGEASVAVVGLGLIGGSIAAALRARQYSGNVVGVGRSRERLEGALAAGLVDEVTTESPRGSLVVYCTPVDLVAEQVRSHSETFEPGTLVTDAGSVKGAIRDAMPRLAGGVEYVGSHPLAGSEKTGYEHAAPDLFVDRVCIVTPDESTTPEARQRLERFWAFLGMRVVEMSAEQHDRVLGMTSHVPHAVASAVAGVLADAEAPFAATGFRDTTRIAAGDPAIWVPILLANRDAALAGLDRVRGRLDEFRHAVKYGDARALDRLLAEGARNREALDD